MNGPNPMTQQIVRSSDQQIPELLHERRFTRYESPLVAALRRVATKLDLNLILFIEPQSITK